MTGHSEKYLKRRQAIIGAELQEVFSLASSQPTAIVTDH